MRPRYFAGDVEAPTEFSAISVGDLMGLPVYKEVSGDPLLGGRYIYKDGGWEWVAPCPTRPFPLDPENNDPPECSKNCIWRQAFSGFELQRNALRMEIVSMVATDRCGWNIRPNHIGGRPLDYAACTFTGQGSQP